LPFHHLAAAKCVLFLGAQGTECCIKEGEAPDRRFSVPYPEGTFPATFEYF
jgi:hypothetical protein